MAQVHSFALAVRTGRTVSPSVVVPANVKRVAITLSDLDLAVIQNPATRFTLGIEYLADDQVTWLAATCQFDGGPIWLTVPAIFVGLSTHQGETIRAFIDSATPLSFSGSVDVT